MPEFRMEMPKTPESDWSKLLETVSQEKFSIQTSLPRELVGKQAGGRVVQFEKNSSEFTFPDGGMSEPASYFRVNSNNKEIFKRTPEAVIFTEDNKALYILDPGASIMEKSKKENIDFLSLSKEDQTIYAAANWFCLHSSPKRAGNCVYLSVDLEKAEQRNELERAISENPLRIRELLEKMVKERMPGFEDYWHEWNPDNLSAADLENPEAFRSVRPPWEFWKKLGLDQMYIQYSDSTKEKPHAEYRKIDADRDGSIK